MLARNQDRFWRQRTISWIKILDQNHPACKCYMYSMDSFSPDQASLLVSKYCSLTLSLIAIHMYVLNYLHVHIILYLIILLG